MSNSNRTFGSVLRINVKLGYAVILGLIAYYSWPSNPKWWGFGLITIFVGMAAIALTIEALRDVANLILLERALKHFSKRGKQPKSAKLANDDDLEQAGMQ